MGRGYTQRRSNNQSINQPLEDRVKNKDIYQRMNFLYQLSLLTSSGPCRNTGLSRFYAATMKRVGSRTVVRIDQSVKATICKTCHSSILPFIETQQQSQAIQQEHIQHIQEDCRLTNQSINQLSAPVTFSPDDIVGGVVELVDGPRPHLTRTCRKCGTKRRIGTKQEICKHSDEVEQ